MFPKARLPLLLAVLVALSLAGCSDKDPRLPVTGTVLFKGEPLEHGNIQLLTTVGPPGPAAGAMIKNGRYDISKVHGLEPGSYRVLISSTMPVKAAPADWPAGASLPTVERIPPAFSSFEASKVLVEVKPPGPVVLDFAIP